MLLHKPTNTYFKNRLEAKIKMGGESNYNKAQKNGEILFIND